MASFPAPHLERRRFQTLPDEGSPLTEPELLQLLYDLLKPLEAITYAFECAYTKMGEGEATTILVQFIQEILEQAVLLLEAWYDHQPSPRGRAIPAAAPSAAEPWPEANEPEDEGDDEPEEASSPPPTLRRSRRPETDA